MQKLLGKYIDYEDTEDKLSNPLVKQLMRRSFDFDQISNQGNLN